MVQTYIYSLTKEFLDSLELLYFDIETHKVVKAPEAEVSESGKQNNVIKDKQYYKSDLHRYNLKRAQNDLEPINEDEFNKLLEAESAESASEDSDEYSDTGSDTGSEHIGSDTDGDDDSETEGEGNLKEGGSIDAELSHSRKAKKVESLLRKLHTKDILPEEVSSGSHLHTRSPMVLFLSLAVPTDKVVMFYKALFTEAELKAPLESLKRFQNNGDARTGKSAIFMLGGGHFAGAVISHEPVKVKGQLLNEELLYLQKIQSINVLESKTFHRYTTRRKQGGSQGASDNSRGKAISAGSSIRRYNEQALAKEVRELLETWRDHLRECDSIYIRANGPTNKKVILGYEEAPLAVGDPRVKKVPFSTKRASLSEIKRIWVELSNLKVLDFPKVETKAKATSLSPSPSPSPSLSRPLSPAAVNSSISNARTESSKSPQKQDPLTEELLSALKRQKAPAFVKLIKEHSIDVDSFSLSILDNNAPSLLHFASANDLAHMVQVLLVNLKASPLVVNKTGKYPAEVSRSNAKRAFQIARSKLGEAAWDWNKAKVLPAKTKEEFDKEAETKEAEMKKEKLDIMKKLQEKEAQENEAAQAKVPQSKSPIPPVSKMLGLNAEQKNRLMREQRARAAEARLKRQT